MDGNGRWASKKKSSTINGHKAGAQAARIATETAAKNGIEYLTLYAFSSENWNRDKNWLIDFFGLLSFYLEHEVDQLHQNGVCIRCIGDKSRLPKNVQILLQTAEEKTKNNTKITVILALSYSGRDEIIRAVNKIIVDAKEHRINEIDAQSFETYLDTYGIPDPDLLIRTSGEQRISNYLLWQMAYTEFVFYDALWPDFTEEHFEKALYEYANRERRFGKDSL
jgi:undecaprenyl diphosphate synthase